MNMREMIQQKKVSQFDFNLDKITLVIPFKAHNSKYILEEEHLRDRHWHLSLSKMNIKSIENEQANDIYEKFGVSIGTVGFKFGKRDYPKLLNMVEDFNLGLLIQLKCKLKS